MLFEKHKSYQHVALFSWSLLRLPHAAVGLLLIVGLSGCKDAKPATQAPIPIRVVTVSEVPVSEVRHYTGSVRARYESDVSFRVAGKIVERTVNVGDRVSAGTLIARIDATDLKLSEQAQRSDLSAAKSARDQAVAAEQRFVVLKQKGWVAQAALDIRIAAADEARARVDRAERAHELSRNQVSYTELRAGQAGVVSVFSAEAGQVIAAGQTIARIARLDELEAVVAIPEQRIADVKGALARVTLWPATDTGYEARLREIAPEADRGARTFEARFAIAAPDDRVLLGKTATVMLTPAHARNEIRLPLSAVMNDAKGNIVWVVTPSKTTLERRTVSVERFTQDHAVIGSGLAAGEHVVALGVHRLDEGARVQIVETRSMADAATFTRDQH